MDPRGLVMGHRPISVSPGMRIPMSFIPGTSLPDSGDDGPLFGPPLDDPDEPTPGEQEPDGGGDSAREGDDPCGEAGEEVDPSDPATWDWHAIADMLFGPQGMNPADFTIDFPDLTPDGGSVFSGGDGSNAADSGAEDGDASGDEKGWDAFKDEARRNIRISAEVAATAFAGPDIATWAIASFHLQVWGNIGATVGEASMLGTGSKYLWRKGNPQHVTMYCAIQDAQGKLNDKLLGPYLKDE